MVFDSDSFEADYAKQEHFTVSRAHIRLLQAIYDKSVEDNDVETWADYWLNTPPWPYIWEQIQALVEHRSGEVGYGKDNSTESSEGW